ncbi:SUMF1/EgtB/PvdO family nonheme iron enzyme [Archangium sp.]|uniref:LIC_10091 family protein n=1 Tax=Archangium sp. TaxID=1872627 RepID=UPI00286AD2A7|nr:SUMF1/EgtB/PvdO family nonheme iron enzyme [Archangium sp.]
MTSLMVLWLVMAVPCEKTLPPGMVCVEGGDAIVGADDRTPAEKPRHSVYVETFYLDTKEVTVGDYTRCERAGACPRLPRPAYYARFQRPELPAVPITWDMAHQYCVFAGKRLPSEAEWEKAARGPEGRTYPWGEDAPSCDKANYKGCPDNTTLPPGRFPPGPYGVHDLAGNGYEWVKDHWTPSHQGTSARGPCDGARPCKGFTQRVLKGGSWYWPEEMLRGSWRRGEKPSSGLHRLSFRCAASTPRLSAWPPRFITEPPARPADPTPPSAQELAQAQAVVEDTDIFQIPVCKRAGKARVDCRDPMSYIKSNEALQYLWGDAIKNVGGGYVGLGADQGYSFIAHARSQWAWVFDYDPTVIRLHHVLRAVVKRAAKREDFVAAFTDKRAAATRTAIEQEWASLPEDERSAIVSVFDTARRQLWAEYSRELKPARWTEGFGWLQTEDNYRYVRLLMQQGRVIAVKGNMLTDKALPSIARAAKSLGVPIRVYYPSNAEEQWKQLPQQYRDNVRQLPFDERSVILRTLITKKFHKSGSYWHYLIHGGLHAQEHLALPGYENVWSFMEDRQQVGAFFATTVAAGTEDKPARKRYLDFLSYIGVPSGRTEPAQ